MRAEPGAPPAARGGFGGAANSRVMSAPVSHLGYRETFCRDVVFTRNQKFCCSNLYGEKHSSNAVFVESFLSFPNLKTYLDLVSLVGFWMVWICLVFGGGVTFG